MDKKSAIKISQAYGKAIRQNFSINKIFIFGSYVNGKAHEESDIDIAVVFNDFENKMDIQMELLAIRRKFDSRIEPHPFRKNEFNFDNPLASEVLKYGKEI
jgi:uncharacterized protein